MNKLATFIGTAAAAVLALAPQLAYADDPPGPSAADNGDGVHAAPKKRDFYFRLGGILVKPYPKSNEVEIADIDGPASLALMNGPIKGSGATIGSAWTVGGSLGYRLPFSHQQVSLEVVLGLPFTVKFKNTGTLANEPLATSALNLPTGVQPLGSEMGQAQAAPPVVTAVYTIVDHGYVQPYVGLGIGFLFTLDPEVTNPQLTEVAKPSMSVSPAVGLVLQAGVDIKLFKAIHRDWFLRLDVKYMAFMHANAEVHNIIVTTPDIPLFGNVDVGTAKLSMTVNPVVFNAGIGFDFL